MAEILILTSRNVISAGGEFSLIKNRANAFERYWGLTSDIVALANEGLGVSAGKEAFGSGAYIWRDFRNPVSLLTGYRELHQVAVNKIVSGDYRLILLSGAGLLRYVDSIKQVAKGALVCADVHGYFGDGRLLARSEALPSRVFHTLASVEEEWEQRTALKRFDRIFTVSSAYRDYLTQNCGCRAGQFYVVPCAVDETVRLTTEQQAAFRAAYRSKYHFQDEDLVLLYSGGASTWQCLPQTVELYQRIKKMRPAKLLILSGDKQAAAAAIGNADDVIIDSYKPSRLPEVFCVADFCVMLRENHPTNNYAYPNKFLEYIASYRPVIATPYVNDIAEQIERYHVGLLFTDDTDTLVAKIDSYHEGRKSFDALLEETSFHSTLARCAEEILNGQSSSQPTS